jgi:hypothetical protein
MASPSQLLKSCCTPETGRQQGDPVISVGLASPRILRAGEHVDFLAVDLTPTGREVFSKFNSERDYITTQICYCSVFDECWIKDGGDDLLFQKDQSKLIHPKQVPSCSMPKMPYQLSAATPEAP